MAPIKEISLPRLELFAAVLLAQLQEKAIKALSLPGIRIFLWTDSTIVLSWIRARSKKWATFVANRVGEVQRLTRVEDWRHVDTKSNPADIISRGGKLPDLMQSSLWWEGPDWLKLHENNWPKSQTQYPTDLPEQVTKVLVAKQEYALLNELISKYSKLLKLVRVVAYVCRYINNCRPSSEKRVALLTSKEYEHSLRTICKFVQQQHFGDEIRELKKSKVVSANSKLRSLNPLIDNEGLLRVGGRLSHAELSYDAKHPILLPKGHTFTRLIIHNEHIRNMYSGIQATIYAVRNKFWPMSAKSTTRDIIRKCVTCWKAKPTVAEAIMSDLPSPRVNISRPFTHCGVDFGGPFLIREHKRRNAKLIKAYICIFVCFAIKAVHIELVADLTTESFLGAFKRFIARRGKVSCVYSDNGTNFIGAARELNELYEFFMKEQTQSKLNEFFVEHRIEWRTIPPNAPHFGGIWEAAIKSAKYHMKRIIGDAALNYDEMSTLLAEIEAILNSRPISQLSSDPNDIRPLSPGHFLVGDSLNSYAQPDISLIKMNRLSRWQRVEQLKQHFWQRWSLEYLNQMQARSKWMVNKGENIKPGQIVLIQKLGLAPFQWLLGRIDSVNKSNDGVVRSAAVRTSNGIITRPLTKLSVLPLDS